MKSILSLVVLATVVISAGPCATAWNTPIVTTTSGVLHGAEQDGGENVTTVGRFDFVDIQQ